MNIDKNSKDINRLYNAEETLNTRKQFLDHVEKWLTHHTTQNDDDLTGLSVLLADGVIDFTQIDHDDLEAFPGIRDGLSKAFNFASKQFELYDQRLDSLHSKFAKDFEDLDLQIVTDKSAFRNYLSTLTYAEEYYFISRKLKKIHDSIGSGRK
ncbi:MAG: hypothetical protein VXB01_08440, partial [Opitutae bacterium]